MLGKVVAIAMAIMYGIRAKSGSFQVLKAPTKPRKAPNAAAVARVRKTTPRLIGSVCRARPTRSVARPWRRAVGVAVRFAALITAASFAPLASAPRLPARQLRDPRILTALHVETAHRVRGSQPWTRVPRPHPHPLTGQPTPGLGRPLTVGFYVSWDPAAQESLERHVDQLDVV